VLISISSYVHGIMDGEILEMLEGGCYRLEAISISKGKFLAHFFWKVYHRISTQDKEFNNKRYLTVSRRVLKVWEENRGENAAEDSDLGPIV
jgi:hypothetical protein